MSDAAQVDPWMHRSKKMKCATCMWFAQKCGIMPEDSWGLGRCRKHAPTLNGYPVVYNTDWCGDYKIDETKV